MIFQLYSFYQNTQQNLQQEAKQDELSATFETKQLQYARKTAQLNTTAHSTRLLFDFEEQQSSV